MPLYQMRSRFVSAILHEKARHEAGPYGLRGCAMVVLDLGDYDAGWVNMGDRSARLVIASDFVSFWISSAIFLASA